METLQEDEHNGVYLLESFLQNYFKHSKMHLKMVSVKSASFIEHFESSKVREMEINLKTSLQNLWHPLNVLRQGGDVFPKDFTSP